jgi:hypothetical protein
VKQQLPNKAMGDGVEQGSTPLDRKGNEDLERGNQCTGLCNFLALNFYRHKKYSLTLRKVKLLT